MTMHTIQTTIKINTQHQLIIPLPENIPEREYNAVLVIEEKVGKTGLTFNFPVDDYGHWPDNLSLSREDWYGELGR